MSFSCRLSTMATRSSPRSGRLIKLAARRRENYSFSQLRFFKNISISQTKTVKRTRIHLQTPTPPQPVNAAPTSPLPTTTMSYSEVTDVAAVDIATADLADCDSQHGGSTRPSRRASMAETYTITIQSHFAGRTAHLTWPGLACVMKRAQHIQQ